MRAGALAGAARCRTAGEWRQRRLFGLLGRVMDGLAAFRYVLARARNGVAAREERGGDDQKQSDESHHVVPFDRFLAPAAVASRIRMGTVSPSGPARALGMNLIVSETRTSDGVQPT